MSDSNNNHQHHPENPLKFTLIIIISSTVCSVTLCLLCGLAGLKVAQMKRKIKCPLCRLWIHIKYWTDGSHRQLCAIKNSQFLKNLSEPFDIRCPSCLCYLKLMPQDFGPQFTCDDMDCPFGNKTNIYNNGHNRISCFLCDYDLCDSCVHRRIYVLSKCISQQPSNHSFCNLDVDIFPIVPNNAGSYLNPNFYPDDEADNCVLQNTLGIPVIQQHSTYV
jgi:hypothetical protein